MFALAALTDSWSTGLVGGIYRWVAMCYGLVRELSTCVNLDDLNLDSFGNAIYTLVGIFMLFRLAISLINALINPDKIHDGKTGVGKILTRIMVSLVLVLAGPLIFNLLFDIQEAIVSPESSASILNLFGNNHSSINMFPVDDNSNEESLGDINQPTVDKDNNEVTPYEKVLPDSQQEGRETFTCYYALVDLNISRNSSGSGSAALNFNDVVGVTFTKNSSYSNAQGFKCIYNGLFGGCADSGAGAGWNTKFFGPTLISNSGTVYDSSDLKFDNFQTRYGAWDDKNSGAVVDSYNCNNLLKGEIRIKTTNIQKNKKKKNLFICIIVILLIILILLGPLGMGNKIMKNMYSRKYENIVEIYSQKYQVDPNLIFAIIKAESNFNATAVSGKGAKGLMQLMEDTAKDVCKKVDTKIDTNKVGDKLLEADINIELGTKYISILLEKYNNIAIALTAYNAGIGTVDNWIEKGIIQNDGEDIQNIPYKETNNYVRKILRDYKIYQKIYND